MKRISSRSLDPLSRKVKDAMVGKKVDLLSVAE